MEVQEIQSPEIEPSFPKPTKKKFSVLVVLLFFALLFLVVGAIGFWFYQQITQKDDQLVVERLPSKQETESVSQPAEDVFLNPGLATGKVFYTNENNIFAYDTENKQVSKLTDYPQNEDYSPAYDESGKQKPNISIKSVRVIDKNNIGFGKCEIITGDFACGLYVLDLETRQVVEKKKLNKEELLLVSDWYGTDRFSYLTSGEKWRLYLDTSGGSKVLEELTGAYGRGGFVEDSEKIRFSPDGKYVLQISTSSPRAAEDFNVYIYTVGFDVKTVLSNATQPEWIDDNKIVYRRYNGGGDGLYVYDVLDQTQKKIQGVKDDSYFPEVLSGEDKILY
ncbi:MAG: hypothetical protein ABID04_00110, partial [Patescibacteria group bacterium]